ncbi:rhamnan synthesis F family protein [Cellulomonas sp.]|uniref:rhamnan synthesis F family protein n=1 Tax=Cellulomonas sp. TaxID=40001 RepID=UPI001B1FAF4A|nr:rhamnan synthesis F family protein [Cellulomonas sp.]MBO9556695.1 hypothetical protein [Cellulomonas sp.]
MVAGAVRVEVDGGRAPADRVAVLVHHAERAPVARSFRELVATFVAGGYRVVVVSSSPARGPLDWGGDLAEGVTVLRKPNVGYDFGSWSVGLAHDPSIARARHVVLANDSLVGPFADVRHVLAAGEASTADVWGVTETEQFRRHLQSYWLAFHGGVLTEQPLAWFYASVRHHEDKQRIIMRNELGLARLLQLEGFSTDALFPARSVVDAADNPTIAGWERLLDAGLPFVKREISRRPELAPRGEAIADEVLRRYGTRIDEWL